MQIRIKDLQQFSINVIYQQMMSYQKFNCQMVCSFSARDVQNNKIIVGTHILADILKMEPQQKIKIQQITPLGIFNSNLTFNQFIQAYHNQEKQKRKIQPILKRKIVSRVNINSKNNQIKNKQSQQNLQNNIKKNQKSTKALNNNTKNTKKLQYEVNKNEKGNQINLPKNSLQKIRKNSQLPSSQTDQSKRSNLKIISTSSESDDEKKLLNQFNIDLNKKIESQNPIIPLKNQFKQTNDEIDEDEQYQLFLKAQKIKAQNKNFNVPDKVLKNVVPLKTEQKIGTNLKSATQNPLKQKKMPITTTQPTLFSFVSKK